MPAASRSGFCPPGLQVASLCLHCWALQAGRPLVRCPGPGALPGASAGLSSALPALPNGWPVTLTRPRPQNGTLQV